MSDLNVIYRIAADISGLKSGVDRATTATEGLEAMASRVGTALTAAFTVGAILKLGSDVLDFASTLEDLSAQTGISTTGLQEFDLAFSQAGVTMEAVAAASAKLANNLVGGDKSTVDALTKLGLSVKDLKQLAPEDQFIKVGDAIGKIQNPTERAYAAMQVFGKGGAELLKGLDGHLGETVAQFEELGLVVDEQTIKAIDDFGDQLGIAGKQLLALAANAIGPLLPMLGQLLNALMPIAKVLGETLGVAIKGVQSAFLLLASIIDNTLASILEGLQKIPGASKVFGDLRGAITWLRTDAQKADAQLAALWTTTEQVGASAKQATPPLIGLGRATKTTEDAAKKAADAFKKLRDHLEDIEGAPAAFKTLALVEALKQIGTTTAVPTLKDLATFSLRAATDVDDLRGSIEDLQRQGRFGSAVLADLTKTIATLPAGIAASTTAMAKFRTEEEGAKKTTDDWSTGITSLGQAFVNLAQVSKGSMSDVARAIGTVLETMDLAAKSGDIFTKGLADVQTGKLEAGVGRITTSLVSMVGALHQATGSASTLQNVLSGAATGFSFGGPYGAILGGIYGAVRSATAGLSASELAQAVTDAKEAFTRLHGGLQQLYDDAQTAGISLLDLMQIFNNTRTVEEFTQAIQGVQDALEFQAAAMQTLDEAVEKYGFTLAEIGPMLQRQNLDKQAQQLYQDFKVLTAAGIDTATVIAHMSDAINAFVQSAIATGTEVPAAMKPILEQMIAQGQLIDATGTAYESLEDTGISFAETLTQGFNRLIATVDKLTAAIARGLGLALDNLPDEKNVDVNVRTHYESDTPPETPSPETGYTPEYAATGGVVTTRGIRPVRWTPIGSDIVPTMLTPGEVVLTEAQTGQLAAALQQSTAALQANAAALEGAGGAARVEVNLTLNVDGVFSEGDLVSTIQRRVVPIIHETWNNNVAGTRTRARDVLGVG